MKIKISNKPSKKIKVLYLINEDDVSFDSETKQNLCKRMKYKLLLHQREYHRSSRGIINLELLKTANIKMRGISPTTLNCHSKKFAN